MPSLNSRSAFTFLEIHLCADSVCISPRFSGSENSPRFFCPSPDGVPCIPVLPTCTSSASQPVLCKDPVFFHCSTAVTDHPTTSLWSPKDHSHASACSSLISVLLISCTAWIKVQTPQKGIPERLWKVSPWWWLEGLSLLSYKCLKWLYSISALLIMWLLSFTWPSACQPCPFLPHETAGNSLLSFLV